VTNMNTIASAHLTLTATATGEAADVTVAPGGQ